VSAAIVCQLLAAAPVTNPVVSSERLVWRVAVLILVTAVTAACISGKCVPNMFIRLRFRATTRTVGQMVVLFAFVHDVVAKCTYVSEERPVAIFRVATVVKVNALVIQWNKYVGCIRIVGDIWPVTTAEGGK